jgi:Mce-associated membrane protein
MTTPEDPLTPVRPSATGWPVDAGEARAPLKTGDPTDAEQEGWPAAGTEPEPEPEPELEPAPEPDLPAASEEVSVEAAPVVGRDEEGEPEPDLPAASEEMSVEAAPVVGRNEEGEPEPGPEPDLPAASEEVSVEVAPVVGRDEDGEPEPEPEPDSVTVAAERGRRVPVLAGVALAVATVAMLVANGVIWHQVRQHSATERARQAALDTTRDAARVLFSYDYRTLSKDFSAGKSVTTGKFRSEYSTTTSKVVAPLAVKQKVVVKAEVVTAGVVRATSTTVVTIVYVNQVTTSSLAAAPKIDLSRVRMTLEHVGGRWLVSNVDAL